MEMNTDLSDLLVSHAVASTAEPLYQRPAGGQFVRPASASLVTGSAPAADDPIKPETMPQAIHESGLADLLGITANRVRILTRDGQFRRTAPATYNLREAVRGYCANLREHAGRAGRPAAAENDALKAEKLRLARQQADKLEIGNAAARGELVKVAEVEREWANVLRDVRSTLLAVPSRLGAKLPHLTAHDVAEIDREMKAALEGLAHGN